jgi:hypothetical protein
VPTGRQVSGSQWDAKTSLPSVSGVRHNRQYHRMKDKIIVISHPKDPLEILIIGFKRQNDKENNGRLKGKRTDSIKRSIFFKLD